MIATPSASSSAPAGYRLPREVIAVAGTPVPTASSCTSGATSATTQFARGLPPPTLMLVEIACTPLTYSPVVPPMTTIEAVVSVRLSGRSNPSTVQRRAMHFSTMFAAL